MSTTKKNKYHSKLKNCYYAPATIDEEAGKITYADPVRIWLSVSIALSPKGDLIVVHADGQEVMLGSDNAGYDGDLEMLRVPESFETDCLGAIKNADGTITETTKSSSKPFALLFEFDADAKNIRHCLFLCYAKRPSVEAGNSESKAPTNEKLSISVRPTPDGYIKTKTGDSTTAEAYDNWYKSVPVPAAPTESTEE